MRMRLKHLAVAALTLLSPLAIAGEIEPGLQAQLQSASGNDEVHVIVRLSDKLDLDRLRKDYVQALRFRERDIVFDRDQRRSLKRSLIVNRLRDHALDSQYDTLAWLRRNGQKGELMSLWTINALAGPVQAKLVPQLAALPGVDSIVHDAIVQGPVPAAVPTAPTNWNLDAIGAPDVWNLGFTGEGVVVGSLDSGVDATHPDLATRYRGGTNSWFDPHGEHAEPTDLTGHGTQVMGLIVGGQDGGTQIGVAPDANWISAKIFNDANEAPLSAIHAAFQWVLDPDDNPNTDDAPDVVNNSWVLANTVNQCNQEFTGDIDLLREAGIVVVFSAGNFGPDANTSVTPANDVGSLPVGSVDDQGNISTFSSRGANACDGGIYPNIVAPGESLLTAEPAPGLYNVVSGSSFAAAHVSGALAVLKGAFPDASAAELETSLTESATDLGAPGPDDTFGNGMLSVAAAYDWLVNNNTPGPGTLQFSTPRYQVAEGTATIAVTVSRSSGTAGQVTVDYTTRDGTALAGQDYEAASGTLTFLDGETTQTITVTVINDTQIETDEEFDILISNETGGARLGRSSTAAVTIVDDDEDQPPPPPPPGAQDLDADGFDEDVDCDDTDASIHPAAIEIARDGIDQDCDGMDLTTEIVMAKLQRDKVYVRATNDLGSEAALSVTYTLEDGSTVSWPMRWRAKYGRWQHSISRVTYRLGSKPVAVRVSGADGEVTVDVRIAGRTVQ